MTHGSRAGRIDWPLHRGFRRSAVGWGVLAGVLLLAVYAGIVAAANSLQHAAAEFLRLWYWMGPIIMGFALQVGLFAYARGATRGGHEAHGRGVAASGGASTLSMVACCAHHITDILPVIGFAGAVTVLASYQDLFLLLGVLSNLVGVVYILGLLRRHGLYPSRRSLLSLSLAWPVDKALPVVIAGSVVAFSAAVATTVL